MPHSIKEEMPSSPPVADAILPDADEIAANDEVDADQEMTMVEAGVQEGPSQHVKEEVKLEDLFADIDSDEEFPSSNVEDVKVASSLEAPSSPVYVHMLGIKRNSI